MQNVLTIEIDFNWSGWPFMCAIEIQFNRQVQTAMDVSTRERKNPFGYIELPAYQKMLMLSIWSWDMFVITVNYTR